MAGAVLLFIPRQALASSNAGKEDTSGLSSSDEDDEDDDLNFDAVSPTKS